MNLFDRLNDEAVARQAPLADRMRPLSLDEMVGQEKIVGEGRILRNAIVNDRLHSMIFWGPPGSGKTTLARVIAEATDSIFVFFSAVTCGVKEVREIVARARERLAMESKRTVLFVDEIHRFNKAQQDAFLPHVENGTLILIGATTENPSFEVNSALLSRSQVYVLESLGEDELVTILTRALVDERGLGGQDVDAEEEALRALAKAANGDARKALNALDIAASASPIQEDGHRRITFDVASEALQRVTLLYDRNGDQHYDLISALHKSLRGSDPQAGLYYLARMLEAGEDPLFVTRRLVRFASEDVGLADPQAVVQAMACRDAVHFLGMPEANTALAQLVVYLATAPKSNRSYVAYKAAAAEVRESGNLAVPHVIRNAPTRLMKNLGYGKDYRYPHDDPRGFVGAEYLPDALRGRRFYEPGPFGFEKEVRKRLDYWERLRKQERSPDDED